MFLRCRPQGAVVSLVVVAGPAGGCAGDGGGELISSAWDGTVRTWKLGGAWEARQRLEVFGPMAMR
jgi:hypothetical protein